MSRYLLLYPRCSVKLNEQINVNVVKPVWKDDTSKNLETNLYLK